MPQGSIDPLKYHSLCEIGAWNHNGNVKKRNDGEDVLHSCNTVLVRINQVPLQ